MQGTTKQAENWVRQRLRARSDEEVYSILDGIEPRQAERSSEILRGTVEEQCIRIGRNTYTTTLFTIPFMLRCREALSINELDMSPVMQSLMQRIKRSAGFRNGDGAVLLGLPVSAEALRDMSYGSLYQLSREIFMSSFSGRSPRRILDRSVNEDAFVEMPDGFIFCGHLVGVRYVKNGASARDRLDRIDHAYADVASILRFHFTHEINDNDVTLGRAAPAFEAIEQSLLQRTDEVLDTVGRSGLLGSNTVMHVGLHALTGEPFGCHVKCQSCTAAGEPDAEFSFRLNQKEAQALPELLRRIHECVQSYGGAVAMQMSNSA